MRSLEERKTPRGLIVIRSVCPVIEDRKIWDIKYKCWDYDFTESKTVFFRNYPYYKDGKGDRFEKGYCQACLQKIEHYTEKYYKEEFEYNQWNSFELSEQSNFCKKCAETLSDEIINHGWNSAFVIKDRWTTCKDNQFVEVKEYADGSIIEEMTSREFSILNR